MNGESNSTPRDIFQVGGSLPPDASTYIEREADDQLYQGLKAREFCYVLNSRQMGKSSLRVQVMKRLQAEGVACAFIDITQLGSQGISPKQWYGSLVRILTKEFDLTNQFNLRTWIRERGDLTPIQILGEFVEEVVLVQVQNPIVIFVDEIDSILSLDFPTDDFFAFIRACYNKRVDKSEYQRLTIVPIGVATPSTLIQDKSRTPFNIGRGIELKGFQLDEVHPLAEGLTAKTSNPQAVLQTILGWSGGQPFLTQKICKLALATSDPIPLGGEAEWIDNLVQTEIINNWESRDEPEHLKTIRNRILHDERQAGQLLGMYQQILREGEITADNSPAQRELRLSGLVNRQQDKLIVFNRVYATVFDQGWVTRTLASLRPYAEALEGWLASNCEDESRLLSGQTLQEALAWSTDKTLDKQDNQFLSASQEAEFNRQKAANQRQRRALFIVSALFAISLASAGFALLQGLIADTQRHIAIENAEKAQEQAELAEKRRKEADLAKNYAIKARNAETLQRELAEKLGKKAVEARKKAIEARDAEAKQRQIAEREKRIADQQSQIAVKKRKEAETARKAEIVQRKIAESERQEAVAARSAEAEQRKIAETKRQEAETARIAEAEQRKIAEQQKQKAEELTAKVRTAVESQVEEKIEKSAKLWEAKSQLPALTQAVIAARPMRELGNKKLENDLVSDKAKTSAKQQLLILLRQIKVQNQIEVSSSVWGISISRDGKILAAASRDGTVKLWNIKTGEEIRTLRGHQSGIPDVSISPDGETLASASEDGTVKLWNMETGQEIRTLRGHQSRVMSVRISLDGKTVASGSHDGTVKLWNMKTGKEIRTLPGHQSKIKSVRISPDGETLASAGNDGIVKLWNTKTGEEIRTLRGHQSEVNSLSISSNGETLASASDNGIVKLWNIKTGEEIRTFGGHKSEVNSLSISPDGEALASGDDDGTVKLWNLNTGDEIATIRVHQYSSSIDNISFSPDGNTLAFAGSYGTVKLLKIGGIQPLPTQEETLEGLIKLGCEWMRDYLNHNSKVTQSEIAVCESYLKTSEEQNSNVIKLPR